MSTEALQALLLFFGGLGLFLYGMDVMAEGLQQAAGDKTRKLLEALTNNPLMGLLAGALVTAVIQSSSATTVMVVGFVNAGLMSLNQACGVIMGANIGTTMTSWIVSMGEWAAFLKPEFLAPILLVIGVFIHMMASNSRLKDGAKIMIGFGLLFTGLGNMSGAIKPFVDAPIFQQIFQTLGSNPLLGILAGAGVTAIIQSSSASMGILQTMAMAGAVNWGSAVFIALGQNIGTCITAVLSAVSGDTNARRAAMIHLEFNVIGAAIVGILAVIFFMMYPSMMAAHVSSSGLAIFHTGFNVFATLILFPFGRKLVQLSSYLVPHTHDANKAADAVLILDPRFQTVPNAALSALGKELELIRDYCLGLISDSRACLVENGDQQKLAHEGQEVLKACMEVKKYCAGIDQTTLNESERRAVQRAVFSARDLHQIASDCLHIGQMNEEAVSDKDLHERAIEEINTISSLCENALREVHMQAGLRSRSADERAAQFEKTKKDCLEIRQTLAGIRHAYIENNRSQSAWLVFEAADCYERISQRCLRLADEESWQKSSGLPLPLAYTPSLHN